MSDNIFDSIKVNREIVIDLIDIIYAKRFEWRSPPIRKKTDEELVKLYHELKAEDYERTRNYRITDHGTEKRD